MWDPRAIEGKEKLLNIAIAQHFIRNGQFQIAGIFEKEADAHVPLHIKEQFAEMYQIVEEIKKENLTAAINWCARLKPRLQAIGSSLEFQLHRTCFIKLLAAGKVQDAIAYGKANFSGHGATHMKGSLHSLVIQSDVSQRSKS